MLYKINTIGVKKKLYIIIFIIILFCNSFNIVKAEEDECFSYSAETGFSLYKERVKCLCEKYEPDKSLIIIEDKYPEIKIDEGYFLPKIISIHNTNMNDIYNCGIYTVQKKSLELIKNDLITKNVDLLDNLGKEIEKRIFLITYRLTKLKCNQLNNKNSILKLNILKQTTYETCKYVNYLEYLKEINNKLASLIKKDQTKTTIDEILKSKTKQDTAIDEELEKTYKVFPIAYHAYSEYENNIVIHFLLELLREDYMILRDKLHETLNPINQVVYKISNAMRK